MSSELSNDYYSLMERLIESLVYLMQYVLQEYIFAFRLFKECVSNLGKKKTLI